MNKSSRYNIKIDFKKSHGAFIFDQTTNQPYIDFFSQYSSLALGYNHAIYNSPDYLDTLRDISSIKLANCETLSDVASTFETEFKSYAMKDTFSHAHFCCTGALAIEAAIKTAIDYKQSISPEFITFKGSFHGINSLGPSLTDRFHPVSARLNGLPNYNKIEALPNPVLKYVNGSAKVDSEFVEDVLNQTRQLIQSNTNIACVLMEPIQCTFGDHYFPISFFEGIRQICDEFDIPLIFDEIQVGFGGTGKLWYFEHLPIIPDIVVFGKKTLLSGMMVREKFAKIFDTPIRLEVTWDADLLDMLRCTYAIKAYQEYGILDNVNKMGDLLIKELETIPHIKNLRHCGLLVAFDFENQQIRDHYVNELYQRGFICNPTKDVTIRLRPNLAISEEDLRYGVSILKDAASAI
tara:strand:- start:144 stop:1364 length:1221 start_codon:yes stop_codon:yes gene_type:complete